MSKRHVLVTDDVPKFASKSAIMDRAKQSFGGLSWQTLTRLDSSKRENAGIWLNVPVTFSPLLAYQKETAEHLEWDGSKPTITKGAVDLDLDEAKAFAISKAADKRWAVEVGGTYLGQAFIDTSRETRANLVHHNMKALDDDTHVVTNWKVGPGVFTDLNAALIIAATNLVESHVQAAYDNEAALVGQIVAAADLDALRAIDIETGWPSNEPPEE